MTILKREGVPIADKEAYLQSLFDKARGGSQVDFEELAGIASGRTDLPLARDLFLKLDGKEVQQNG